jgi:hypothetical protein
MLPLEDDPLSPENLVQANVKHFCKLFKFANEIGIPVIPVKSREDMNVTNIHGLACEKNFTLHILAMDSVRNHHFAEFLGVDITKKKDMTTTVILDSNVSAFIRLSATFCYILCKCVCNRLSCARD